MEKANTIALSLNDIIFENRNKSYGAYQLRSIYERYLQRATFLGVVAFSIVLAILWNMFKQEPITEITFPIDPGPAVMPQEPPPVDLPKEILPPSPPVQQQVRTIDYREMQVAHEREIEPEATITRNEDIGNIEISNANQDGEDVVEDLMVDPNTQTNSIIGGLVEETENKIFLTAEQMPEFPGGKEAMAKFLSKNLHFPPSAEQKGVSGVVYISFVVSNTGVVSDIKVLKGIDEACDKEAVRVVEKMPSWKPGRQNGRNVSVRYSLPLRFSITQ